MNSKPIISFEFDIDYYGDMIEMKGYCDNVRVKLPNAYTYKLCFYDPIRLKQDIESEIFIAIPNLIVILTVTKANIENAVYNAWKGGFFDNLKPS